MFTTSFDFAREAFQARFRWRGIPSIERVLRRPGALRDDFLPFGLAALFLRLFRQRGLGFC